MTSSFIKNGTTTPPVQHPPAQDDNDLLIQGLTSAEITLLAQKIYDLMLDELRIEAERHGHRSLR
jgi:hypothetical protein